MIAMLMAKLMLNDIPHSAGLLANPGHEGEPTPSQVRYITILCQQAKITTMYEYQPKTKGEAGRMIRTLEAEVKLQRVEEARGKKTSGLGGEL